MKHNEEIPRTCALCTHAVLSYPESAPNAPPLALFLTEGTRDEERVKISCPYRKEACASYFCRRFRFDPLKYRPKKAPAIQALDEDALLLD